MYTVFLRQCYAHIKGYIAQCKHNFNRHWEATKLVWLILFWYVLYCSGLETNPQPEVHLYFMLHCILSCNRRHFHDSAMWMDQGRIFWPYCLLVQMLMKIIRELISFHKLFKMNLTPLSQFHPIINFCI